jgi:hypothetical protein
MSHKKEDLDEMTNQGQPGCAPARAKQILWSPWGKLPPRGGGGLPQGGDDDDEHLSRQVRKAVVYFKNEQIKLRVIIKFTKKQGVWGQHASTYKNGSCAHWSKACL